MPPTSSVLRLRLPWHGSTLWTYFWVHRTAGSIELCYQSFDLASDSESDGCQPTEVPGGRVVVTDPDPGNVAPGQRDTTGVASSRVASVATVLRDGRTLPGVVATGRGFPYRVWWANYPAGAASRTVFRDASGRELYSMNNLASMPAGPTHPITGGTVVFRYATGSGTDGTMLAYLVGGQVRYDTADGSFSIDGSPSPTSSYPSRGGPVVEPWLANPGGQMMIFGDAHADVARVVVRLSDGRRLSAETFSGGPGLHGLRLFAVRVPAGVFNPDDFPPPTTGIVTAYDARGRVLGREPILT